MNTTNTTTTLESPSPPKSVTSSAVELSSFLTLINQEYEALTTYCNSLSLLSHAIHKNNHHDDDDDDSMNTLTMLIPQQNKKVANNSNLIKKNKVITTLDPNLFLPSKLKIQSKQQIKKLQEESLMEYQMALENLQQIHSKILKWYNSRCIQEEQEEFNHEIIINEYITKHLELSKRVLKTCSSFMKNGYGPLFENGMLKNIGGGDGNGKNNIGIDSNSIEDWHEIRIVALTAYRGSIARLKQVLE